MFDRLEIFQMAHGMARHAAARQASIAGNIANADTPGYRAQDVRPFAETYRAGQADAGLRGTRPGHLMAGPQAQARVETFDRPGPSDPNGNTVSLEAEMLNAVAVRRDHDKAVTIYQTSLNILRTSLGRAR